MKKEVVTNVMRELKKAKIDFEALYYELSDEEFSGERVAQELGIDAKACLKTLSLLHGNDLYLCVISSDDNLDLKKSAKAFNVKNLEMVKVKDLLKTVGYQRGSVSPVGVKKRHQVMFDDVVKDFEDIYISGGQKGVTLKVKRDTIIAYLNAKVGDIVND